MENAHFEIKTALANDGYSKEEHYFAKLNRSLIEKIKQKKEGEKPKEVRTSEGERSDSNGSPKKGINP